MIRTGTTRGLVASRRSMVAARGMAHVPRTSARAAALSHATSFSSCRRWASSMSTPRAEDSSPLREGVIWTKWPEELMLPSPEQIHGSSTLTASHVWWLSRLQFVCSFELEHALSLLAQRIGSWMHLVMILQYVFCLFLNELLMHCH
uniref:Uncharacterized protein n=1 Tax=Oryza glumipatula TaxID=40148 RepID=A0A0D9Z943_9ORYZ